MTKTQTRQQVWAKTKMNMAKLGCILEQLKWENLMNVHECWLPSLSRKNLIYHPSNHSHSRLWEEVGVRPNYIYIELNCFPTTLWWRTQFLLFWITVFSDIRWVNELLVLDVLLLGSGEWFIRSVCWHLGCHDCSPIWNFSSQIDPLLFIWSIFGSAKWDWPLIQEILFVYILILLLHGEITQAAEKIGCCFHCYT